MDGIEEITLEANRLRFRGLAAGPAGGRLVLLLHGFPEGAEAWRPQLAALGAAGWRAVAPDLRGYGGTDAPQEQDAYRLDLLVSDVAGLIAALGSPPVDLVGHDWGAIIGWAAAARHSRLLRSWTALSVGHPAALARALADPNGDQRARLDYVRLFRMPGKAEAVLAADGYRRLRAIYRRGPNPEAVPAEVVETYVAGLARPGRLTAALNYYRANPLDEPRVLATMSGRVTVPTTLIWGDSDLAVGRGSAELTAAEVAGPHQLVVVPDAGHWLQFERPAEVTGAILRSLARG